MYNMTLWHSVLLGFVQGFTEFLPVSSSGHLVLFQKLFGINEETSLTLNVFLHFGTLLAVVIVFWKDLLSVIVQPFGKLSRLIIIGTIPTAIIGITLEDYFERLFASGVTIGIEFMITGFVLWLAETEAIGRKRLQETGYIDAAVIGTLQGAAILPAISRSGLTIVGALFRGLDREFAARFSFLLSVPAILGATLMEGKKVWEGDAVGFAIGLPEIAGTLVAAISGYIAIRFMVKQIVERSLKLFSLYVWVVGGLILFDQMFTHKFFPPLF
jgi:undecaprenyl-diphosphatase